MNDDYQRIAQAIDFIRNNVGEQPSLSEVADYVHLSEYHFQRLFCRWAGVTPKRYLQVLTLDYAKTLLQQTSLSALNTSYQVGLSSGSRLYDHFVNIEAVTPLEFRQRGQGLTILYGYHMTPYGQVFVAETERGICRLEFVEQSDIEAPLVELRNNWCNADIQEDSVQTKTVINSIFNQQKESPVPLSLWVRGTNFQLNVWRALLKLQQGQLASYSDIAQLIGKPTASRAVGTAIGANPVALVIPCHRVLRQSGELGGYRWGETRKHAILSRETASFELSEN